MSKIARAALEAEGVNRKTQEVLASVWHDLRTPISTISGWCQVLRHGNVPEAVATRAVDAIDQSAQTLAQMVEDASDVIRLISGSLSVQGEPVDISAAVTPVVESFQNIARSKNIALQIKIEVPNGRVAGDERRLQQIVRILLSNALKFTPSGGSVAVSLVANGPGVLLVVADTGQGIAPAAVPSIFDLPCPTKKSSGLGFGLFTARRLAELHGGTLDAESAGENQGAAFKVLLPVVDRG